MTNEEALAKAEEHEKWGALFKAKADGKVIQYFGWLSKSWTDESPDRVWSFNHPVDSYRIKPVPKKSFGYRRYLRH